MDDWGAHNEKYLDKLTQIKLTGELL
jgi:hypothetical protein